MSSTSDINIAHGTEHDLKVTITPIMREFILFAMWVGVTFVQFPGDELILYPLALYFAYAIYRDRVQLVPLFLRGWPLFLFPLWCFTSVLWAVAPFAALKHAVYVSLTIMICFSVATRLKPRQIILAVFAATAFVGLINLVFLVATQHTQVGIFPQKNPMGIAMAVLWTVSTVVFLDRRCRFWIRCCALVAAAAAFFMVLRSDSATAVLVSLATGSINFFGALLLRGHFLEPQRLAAAFAILGITTMAGALILPTYQENPVEQVLGAFNKDTTLTGRTVLWNYARQEVEDRPLLGLGAHGFWRYSESPLVRRIYEENYKKPNHHFNFHNSYFEIAVHQGLIGLGIAVFSMLWAAGWILRGAFILGGLPHVFFFSQSLAVMVRTMTESDFYRPFVLFHMLFWIGALAAISRLKLGQPD